MDKKDNQDPKPNTSINQPTENVDELLMGYDSKTETKSSKRPFEGSGIVIESGNERRDNKMAKKHETKVSFKDLEALLDKPINVRFKDFKEKIDRLIKGDKKIEGLEARIYAVNVGEYKEFKNDDAEPKKCFWEWQSEFDGCDRDKNTLIFLKNQANDHGIDLCRAVIDFIFLMSVHHYNQMQERFDLVESLLEWIIQGGSSKAISIVLEILRTTDTELRNKKRRGLLGIQWYRDLTFVDVVIYRLLKEIYRFELFWMHHWLPCSQDSLMGAIPSLVDAIKKCEQQLRHIDDLITGKLSIGLKINIDKVRLSDQYQNVDDKINQEWHNINPQN